ncbi:hypothetical protein JCM19037_1560 [Geomicrobium sp. JCM 19037]|uniref:phage tail tube protein n=1 Tax=Geomicrobium sp. JCM 19037 TaxID=1460634 RepID=UPI00045F1DA2|nr:phage tail tube protein [Geomicrobium sp. JCM 19037]GAK03253.1 hypothetical protein JCM19037_1560 [Geomicrobium sp. JCM 19037]
MNQPIDVGLILDGANAKVFDDQGRWLYEATSFNAECTQDYEDVLRAGTNKKAKRPTGVECTGAMTVHHTNDALIKKIKEGSDDGTLNYITELRVEVGSADHGSKGIYRFKGVQYENLPIIDYEVGSLISREFQFNFEDVDIIQGLE